MREMICTFSWYLTVSSGGSMLLKMESHQWPRVGKPCSAWPLAVLARATVCSAHCASGTLATSSCPPACDATVRLQCVSPRHRLASHFLIFCHDPLLLQVFSDHLTQSSLFDMLVPALCYILFSPFFSPLIHLLSLNSAFKRSRDLVCVSMVCIVHNNTGHAVNSSELWNRQINAPQICKYIFLNQKRFECLLCAVNWSRHLG